MSKEEMVIEMENNLQPEELDEIKEILSGEVEETTDDESEDIKIYDLDPENVTSKDPLTAGIIAAAVLGVGTAGYFAVKGIRKGYSWVKGKMNTERYSGSDEERHFICLGKKKQAKEDPEVDFGDENDGSPE